MEKIKLTQEKLLEILAEIDDEEKIKYYYEAALNDHIVANQHGALVALLLMLVRYYNEKLFVKSKVNPFDFFGLAVFNEQSEHWKYRELLRKTSLEILMGLINGEDIPQKPLTEFAEIFSHTEFCYCNYFGCLTNCDNAIRRESNNTLCNFLKASIIEICLVNKTPDAYKIALLNYQKSLIDKCDAKKITIDLSIYNEIVKIINERIKDLDSGKEKIQFTLAKENYEKTNEIIKDWTEEHDFYLRNKLFLNPLNDFDNFVNCSLESFENLQIEKEYNELFELIIDDYKMCRGILFSYYKGINNVGKKEMCMTYSYAYSIFDKIAYLLKKVYALKIGDDNTSFTKHGLFDVKIDGTNIRFKDIKNNNVLPLYLIMKEVREKQNIVNTLQVGTFEHNELRNTIDHKSIALVSDDKLKRNASILLGHARNAILYAFMLLHSCNEVELCGKTSAIETTFYKSLMNIEQDKMSNVVE